MPLILRCVLLGLLLSPLAAEARRRPRDVPYEDPVCRKQEGLCWKLAIGAGGGAVPTREGVDGGFGALVRLTLQPLAGLEVGAGGFGLYRLQGGEPAGVLGGTGRLQLTGSSAAGALWAEVFAGAAFSDPTRLRPAYGLGATWELATDSGGSLFGSALLGGHESASGTTLVVFPMVVLGYAL